MPNNSPWSENFKPYTPEQVQAYFEKIEHDRQLAIESLFRKEANQKFQNYTNPIWLIDNGKIKELEKLNNWLKQSDDDFFRTVPQCILNWNHQLPDREIFVKFLELHGKSHLIEKVPHYISGYRAH